MFINRSKGSFWQACLYGLFLLILTVLLGGCGEQTAMSTEKDVAVVGERSITWEKVNQSFYLEPKWGRGLTQKEAYQNQLDFLIEQKLFAQAAQAANIDKTPGIQARLNFIKEKEMIKALYRDRIEGQIDISEEALREAYRRSLIQVKLAYAASPDPARALKYRDELTSGDIDGVQLLHSADQKGLTPLFSFGDMSEELEAVAFDLKMNEVGGPITVAGGYWVIKLIGGDRDLVALEPDYLQRKPSLHKVLFERQSRKLSDAFIADLMQGKKIEINPQTFAPLAKLFHEIVQNKTGGQAVPVYLDNRELSLVNNEITDLADQPLVEFEGDMITVRDFIGYLDRMPGDLRPRVNMAPELKTAVAKMVRNRYLSDLAAEENYAENPRVKADYQAQADALLAKAYLKLLREDIEFDEDYYSQFVDGPPGKALKQQFGERLTEDILRNAFMDTRFLEKRIVRAEQLSKAYPIAMDSALFARQIPHPEKILDENPVRMVYRERFE